MKSPDNPKQWIIDPPAADVVRHIYALCLGGKGPHQIAKQLEEEEEMLSLMEEMRETKSTVNQP